MNPADMTFEQLCELFNYTPKNRKLTNAEAAEVIGIRPNTLEGKRVTGTGPQFFRIPNSRRIFYIERDVLEWLASGAHISTSERARLTATA